MTDPEHIERAHQLIAELNAAKAEHPKLTIVVDNDCWHCWVPGLDPDGNDADADIYDKLPQGDEGPELLSILLSIALGFEAERV